MIHHLWESTLFAAVAALVALVLKNNAARVRHWLWLAASVKFLIPFSLLVGVGAQIGHLGFAKVEPPRQFTFVLEQIERIPAPEMRAVTPAPAPIPWREIGVALWLAGCAVVLAGWFVRWRRVRSNVRNASPIRLSNVAIDVMSSPSPMEPGIYGIWRPVLLLPEGILNRLTDEQLDAVIAHELCHVRRRDNLVAAVHMIVEAAFWFHPLVWWIGARLVEERERACDEEVLRLGKEPEVYAEGILNVCRLYLESPLECVPGVTGADLKKRIEGIMTHRGVRALDFGKKLLLAAIAALAVAGPVAFGVLNTPVVRAQFESKPQLRFEEASIKPSDPNARNFRMSANPGGRIAASGITLQFLIQWAYDVQDFQIHGGPGWLNSSHFDIATVAGKDTRPDDLKPMMRALLADRFKVSLHRETKELPVYALVVAKGGPKIKESAGPGNMPRMISDKGETDALAWTMAKFAGDLARQLGRTVIDKTGLAGRYDFKLQWTPDESRPATAEPGPSIFTAITEQLGLRLESTKAPVEIIVVDRAEKPSGN